jgi:hypothetical protein
MKLTILFAGAFRRAAHMLNRTADGIAPVMALDFGRFPDALYHALSDLGPLITWKWVEKSDLATAGQARHVIIDVPRYLDQITREESPFWHKEATCNFRIVFNPDGGGLISGRQKPSRKEPPNIQIISVCFKPGDGTAAKWKGQFYIHPRQADLDAAVRQVLQTTAQVLEISRHPEARAKLFALAKRAPEPPTTAPAIGAHDTNQRTEERPNGEAERWLAPYRITNRPGSP